MARKISKIGRNGKGGKRPKDKTDVNKYLKDAAGLDTAREQQIGQHIGYRYDVNLLPDYERLTPFLKAYMEFMGWDDLNWLEDVHMGYEAGKPAIFDRNIIANSRGSATSGRRAMDRPRPKPNRGESQAHARCRAKRG
jgi:hypothetical protein